MTRPGGKIYLGTSGWSYGHWKGSFYPVGCQPAQMLKVYADHFSTTEINSTFYRLPSPDSLKRWRRSTPEGFVFSVKASRFITHMKKLKEPEDHVAALLERITLLGEKLGPILFQLPPRWHCNEERLAAFLESLPENFRYAFEFRDQSWLNTKVYNLLSAHNAAFCMYELSGFLTPQHITSDFIYIRLHGPNGPYQGSYSREALTEWSRLLVNWSTQVTTIYCYFDNDEKGFAAMNAQMLQNMVAMAHPR